MLFRSQVLLQAAGIVPDAGVVSAHDPAEFSSVAQTRQWGREPSLRTLP